MKRLLRKGLIPTLFLHNQWLKLVGLNLEGRFPQNSVILQVSALLIQVFVGRLLMVMVPNRFEWG